MATCQGHHSCWVAVNSYSIEACQETNSFVLSNMPHLNSIVCLALILNLSIQWTCFLNAIVPASTTTFGSLFHVPLSLCRGTKKLPLRFILNSSSLHLHPSSFFPLPRWEKSLYINPIFSPYDSIQLQGSSIHPCTCTLRSIPLFYNTPRGLLFTVKILSWFDFPNSTSLTYVNSNPLSIPHQCSCSGYEPAVILGDHLHWRYHLF